MRNKIKIIIKDVKCPQCGAQEMHPDGKHVLIRAYKVSDARGWWSECLVCSGHYDKELNIIDGPHDKSKSYWFCS